MKIGGRERKRGEAQRERERERERERDKLIIIKIVANYYSNLVLLALTPLK